MKTAKTTTFDPAERPCYTIGEAARYLRIPPATLRTWVKGRTYPTGSGNRQFPPLIRLPEKSRGTLSFTNLVEAFVLASIRRNHSIPVAKVRRALDYLQNQLNLSHPLADARFQTDGVDLFVERFGKLVAASESGQLAMKEMIHAHLQRVEHDRSGTAVCLFPFTRGGEPGEPKVIVMDPRLAFGRPCVVGTGAPTANIASRYKAGESIEELAEDFGCEPLKVQEAIRCELDLAA